MIYFDNAATSYPKPPDVKEAMTYFLDSVGASPGRAGHRLALEAGRIVYNAREALAELFHADDPLRIIFTQNVTEALNLTLRGLLRPNDHVITGSLEHNAMMRPLRALERQGIALTVIPCSPEGLIDPADVDAAIRRSTKLIALNHASNVIGTIQPMAQIGQIARQRGVVLLADVAQTAGAYPIDSNALQIDLLAFTGHKALYGPTGTGGLVIGERVNLAEFEPLQRGGTGSLSEQEAQPDFLPDKFESGTLNAVGLAGLGASVRWILQQGVHAIRAHEVMLTEQLIDGLQRIPGVTVYGTHDAQRQTAVVAFNIAGMLPSEAGLRFDDEFEICCRVGLHCSPAAHHTLGTFPVGAVRFGLGAFNTPEEVAAALRAVDRLAQDARQYPNE